MPEEFSLDGSTIRIALWQKHKKYHIRVKEPKCKVAKVIMCAGFAGKYDSKKKRKTFLEVIEIKELTIELFRHFSNWTKRSFGSLRILCVKQGF